jgi:hypothetical protein
MVDVQMFVQMDFLWLTQQIVVLNVVTDVLHVGIQLIFVLLVYQVLLIMVNVYLHVLQIELMLMETVFHVPKVVILVIQLYKHV